MYPNNQSKQTELLTLNNRPLQAIYTGQESISRSLTNSSVNKNQLRNNE